MRIDEFHGPGSPKDEVIRVKEVWLSQEQADAEAARLNAINGDKGCRYVTYYAKVKREV